jgi:hypothetical protein
VPWKRSTLPFWFGDAGAVSRCVIPFLQILSNSTSPVRGRYLPNRSVNCLPLSVMISSGTPNRANASASARQTARAVARSATFAITQNREWSSTAVTSFASRGLGRSHRTNDSFGRFRGRDRSNPCRCRIRSIVRSEGHVHLLTSRPRSRPVQHLQTDPP